ncbi:MAG TPA: CPBP family intramembrane glutamic endopeptidase [Polyangiaceae bacterium]
MQVGKGDIPLVAQAERLGAEGSSVGALGRRRPALLILSAYAVLGAGAAALSAALGQDPLSMPGWLGIGAPAPSALVSAGAGVCVGAVTVATTRVLVRRAPWARSLHEALRPAVKGAADGWLLALAAASAVGEELLFRGLLVPMLGVVLPSVAFGALHQVRGPARWGWMAWATLMGLLFSVLYAATGSLVGPIVAHLMINGANLRYLRDVEPGALRRKKLGGLLRRT